jgi:phage gpG-like protein
VAGFSFKLIRNDISPALAKLARGAKNPEPVFRAMGTTFMSITMGTFNAAGADYRPKPWPAKKDGTPSKLQKSGTLSRSFHLEVTNKFAKVSNPVIYAAIHQFGSEGHVLGKKVGTVKTKYANTRYFGSYNDVLEGGSGIPPRPFFPVENGKLTEKAEEKIRAAGERALARQME